MEKVSVTPFHEVVRCTLFTDPTSSTALDTFSTDLSVASRIRRLQKENKGRWSGEAKGTQPTKDLSIQS
jgi:hypothetical protein